MMELFQSVFAPPRHLILLLGALWAGLALAEKRTERNQVSSESLNNLVFFGLASYLAGGRVVYALLNFPAFMQSPSSLVSLNLDLFDPPGGMLTALLTGWIYALRHNLLLRPTLDALTPCFAMLVVGISLAHLAAGTAFGRPTDLPWGIQLWGAVRHPSQIYELIASVLILCLIWFRIRTSPPGLLFVTFMALTAAARLFLESFRGDSTLVLGGLRLAQVIAWTVLAAALIASERLLQSQKMQTDR